MRLVLLGTEQPNLRVLEALAAGRLPAGDEVLVVGRPTWRPPAMLPGFLAGRYSAQDITLDLEPLLRAARARLIHEQVAAVDVAARTITLEGGGTEAFDLLSLALPLRPAMVPPDREAAGLPRAAWCDVDQLLGLLDTLRGKAGGSAIAVVGAGSTGFEVACALATRLEHAEPKVRIRVVDADAGVLGDRDPASRRLATRVLLAHRIGLALGARVQAVTARGLQLASGAAVPADLVVWCTGSVPPAVLATSGLALDPQGFAEVDGTLRSTTHPAVFAPGRADLQHEGEVLVHNLAVAAGALPGKSFRTRKAPARPPALLYAGGESALVSFGSVAREAGWAWRLKDVLDRREVERFKRVGSG